MKALVVFLSALLVSSLGFGDESGKDLNISGSWKYVSFFYQGQTYPLPDANLNLIFSFDSKGGESIFWNRNGTHGSCQATAIYKVVNGLLDSQIVATNPQNNSDCSDDPDMQVGKESVTPVHIRDGQLFLNIGLSGEDFFYIFNPINQSQDLRSERNL